MGFFSLLKLLMSASLPLLFETMVDSHCCVRCETKRTNPIRVYNERLIGFGLWIGLVAFILVSYIYIYIQFTMSPIHVYVCVCSPR